MKTILRWVIIGILELILCFWILDNAGSWVSAASNFQLWVGILGYLIAFLLPVTSLGYVLNQIYQARKRQRQLKKAFPDDEVSLLQLLDSKK